MIATILNSIRIYLINFKQIASLKFYIIIPLIIISSIHPDEKSSQEIQQEIDSRNNQINLLRQEIITAEERIIQSVHIKQKSKILYIINPFNFVNWLIYSLKDVF